jgi:hypothetical protein
MGVAREMGRLIRLSYNGHISVSELTGYVYALDKTRAALESALAIAIEADTKANAPAPPPAKIAVSIVSVPAGVFISAEQSAQIANGEFLKQIEHKRVPLDDYTRNVAAQAAADCELNAAIEAAAIAPPDTPEPCEAPQSPEEENKVINNLKAEINELSRKMGIDLVV